MSDTKPAPIRRRLLGPSLPASSNLQNSGSACQLRKVQISIETCESRSVDLNKQLREPDVETVRTEEGNKSLEQATSSTKRYRYYDFKEYDDDKDDQL